MSDLISRDALKEMWCANCDNRHLCGDKAGCDDVKELYDMPTIEAEPNSCEYWDSESHFCALSRPQAEPTKHGRWILVSNSEPYNEYVCSVCGTKASSFIGGSEMWYCVFKPHYCPNCGAKMQSTMGQVKHGHWVKYGSPLFSEWECSECGERHTGNDLPDKCPHCKAKMDEVDNG